jgi:cathepsin L
MLKWRVLHTLVIWTLSAAMCLATEANNHRLLTSTPVLPKPISSLKWDEFKKKYLLPMIGEQCKYDPKNFQPPASTNLSKLPFEVNWQSLDSLPPVKDQGDCPASWIFSAIAAIESHSSIFSGEPIRLFSTQQVLDCLGSKNKVNCSHGTPGKVFDYVQRQGGLSLQYLYRDRPMTSSALNSFAVCKYDVTQSGVQVGSGSKDLRPYEDDKLIQALLTQGPVTVLMDGTGLKDYQGGIWDGFYTDENKAKRKCSDKPEDLNHAALLVAVEYVDENNTYYTFMNSWGSAWGENGFFRLKREFNICGISLCVSYPRLLPY